MWADHRRRGTTLFCFLSAEAGQFLYRKLGFQIVDEAVV
jgi:hypothetical protein